MCVTQYRVISFNKYFVVFSPTDPSLRLSLIVIQGVNKVLDTNCDLSRYVFYFYYVSKHLLHLTIDLSYTYTLLDLTYSNSLSLSFRTCY